MTQGDGGNGAGLISAMVDDLRVAEAEQGTFTVDPERAIEQMRKLVLDNPLHWVLVCLRGAVRSGADVIHVDDEGGELVMRWQAALELPDPEALANAGIGRGAGTDRGLRELVLGAYIGINEGLTSISLRGPGRGVVIDEQGIVEQEPGDGGFELRARGKLMRDVDGVRPELWAVARRGRYLDVPVHVRGERINHGLGPTVDLDARPGGELEADWGRAVWGITAGSGREVRFLVDGVWVDAIEAEAAPDGWVAVLDAGLTMDAGVRRVVRSPELDRAMKELQARLASVEPAGDAEDLRRLAVNEAGKLLRRVYPLAPTHIWMPTVGFWVLLFLGRAALLYPDLPGSTTLRMAFFHVLATFAGVSIVDAVLGFSLRVDQSTITARFPPHHPARESIRDIHAFPDQAVGAGVVAWISAICSPLFAMGAHVAFSQRQFDAGVYASAILGAIFVSGPVAGIVPTMLAGPTLREARRARLSVPAEPEL